MSNPRAYDVGTITLTNGSAAFTGDDTGWLLAGVQYGTIVVEGLTAVIEEIASDGAGTLAQPWAGATYTGPYVIIRENSDAANIVDLYDRLTQATLTLSMAGIHPQGLGTIAKRDAIGATLTDEDEFIFLHAELGEPFEYYVWDGPTATSWLGPFEVAQAGQDGTPGVGEGGYGLPAGGTTGQVPAKASGADGDVAWVTPADPEVDAADVSFTPTGDLAATTVQGALAELDSEKANAAATTASLALKANVTAIREKLTANRTYYVRPDGSDSNNGLADTSGGAFLTPNAAYLAALALDLAGFTVTIQLADGTYGDLTITAPVVGGNVVIAGNATTPANVVITSAGRSIAVQSAGNFTIKDMTFNSTFRGMEVVHPAAKVALSNVRFTGNASNSQIYAEYGVIELTGPVEIASSCYRAFSAVAQGVVRASSITITFTGTPAWAGAGFYFNSMGLVYLFSVTLTGAATGKRYDGALNAALNSFGAGTASTYFPGNVNGTATTGAEQA